MNSAGVATKLSADDWVDDKWVEETVRSLEALGSSDAGVPERVDSADDWMDDKWLEERIQGAEASGSLDTSNATPSAGTQFRAQQSARTPSSTILTRRSERQHEAR